MYTTYLPKLGAGPQVAAEGYTDMGVAIQLFTLMRTDDRQGRARLTWNDTLAAVAQDRIENMAKLRWEGHIDPFGYGPNHWVRVAGYALPAEWDDHKNYIESLQWGGNEKIEDAKREVWEPWIASEPHRIHILGLNRFFAAQTQVGIASYYLKSSNHGWYHSIITAPPEPA